MNLITLQFLPHGNKNQDNEVYVLRKRSTFFYQLHEQKRGESDVSSRDSVELFLFPQFTFGCRLGEEQSVSYFQWQVVQIYQDRFETSSLFRRSIIRFWPLFALVTNFELPL